MSDSSVQAASRTTLSASFFRIWQKPLVAVVYLGIGHRPGSRIALEVAKGEECHLLVLPTWTMESQLGAVRELDLWVRQQNSNATITVLAATEADVELVEQAGLPVIWASHSAFIDERIYYPDLSAPKAFAAVHNAKTSAFKRHELAFGVENLALVTYASPGDCSVSELAARYRDLRYVNFSPERGHLHLDGPAVRHVLNQSECGLLLSAVEGANYASMEYFLCGLPLVTTPSKGGREQMYDPAHVCIVEPEAPAVEAAVARYKRFAPDPIAVRNGALAKAKQHRARLIEWLSRIAGRNLFPLADANCWLPNFRDKLYLHWLVEERPDGWNAYPDW